MDLDRQIWRTPNLSLGKVAYFPGENVYLPQRNRQLPKVTLRALHFHVLRLVKFHPLNLSIRKWRSDRSNSLDAGRNLNLRNRISIIQSFHDESALTEKPLDRCHVFCFELKVSKTAPLQNYSRPEVPPCRSLTYTSSANSCSSDHREMIVLRNGVPFNFPASILSPFQQ